MCPTKHDILEMPKNEIENAFLVLKKLLKYVSCQKTINRQLYFFVFLFATGFNYDVLN